MSPLGRRQLLADAAGGLFLCTLGGQKVLSTEKADVEGLSAHLTEWIATGRVDLGLVLNPEPNPAIEVTPLLDEPLGLVGPAQGGKFAVVEQSHEFTLVPWRPVIDRQLGREVIGVVQGGSASWQLGRQRGLGL